MDALQILTKKVLLKNIRSSLKEEVKSCGRCILAADVLAVLHLSACMEGLIYITHHCREVCLLFRDITCWAPHSVMCNWIRNKPTQIVYQSSDTPMYSTWKAL